MATPVYLDPRIGSMIATPMMPVLLQLSTKLFRPMVATAFGSRLLRATAQQVHAMWIHNTHSSHTPNDLTAGDSCITVVPYAEIQTLNTWNPFGMYDSTFFLVHRHATTLWLHTFVVK